MAGLLKKVIKNSGIYSIGNISTKLAGLVLIPLYVQSFSISEYGIYGLLEVSSTLVGAVFSFGLVWAFSRWYWDKEYVDKQGQLFFTTFTFILISAIILILVVFFSSTYIANSFLGEAKYAYLVLLVAIVTAFDMINKTTLQLLKLKEKALPFTFLNLIKLGITLSLTVYLIVELGRGLESIYEALLAGQIFFFISSLPYIFKNITIKPQWNLIKGMVAYSLPIMLSTVSVMILTITDRYALGYLTTLQNVGVYTFGFKISNSIKVLFVNSIQMAITPILYKMINDVKNKQFYGRILTYFTFTVMCVILIVSIFGNNITFLLTDGKEEYVFAVYIIPIIAYMVVFSMMKDISAIGLHIKKRTGVIAIATVTAALINIVLNLVLIPFFKSFGAALATLLSQMILFLITYRNAQKAYYVNYNVTKLSIILSAGAVIIALHLAIFYLYGSILFFKILLLLSFPIVLYSTGVISKSELSLITKTYKNLINSFK